MSYTLDDIEIEGSASHTLLAWQIFVPLASASARRELITLLRASELEPGSADKTRFWMDVTRALRKLVSEAHYGVWDYIDDDEAALEEYQGWCDGTIEDAAEAEPVDPGDAYAFVTVLLLCDAGAAADVKLAEVAASVEDDEWSVSTFQMWLEAVAGLDWRAVKSDTLFVRPGDRGYGVSSDELKEEHYHYLHPLL